MRLRDQVSIFAIIAFAAICGVASAHPLVAAPLGAASLVVTVRLITMLATGDPLRRWVLAIASTIAALIAMGYLLDALPWGLTRASWSIAWGVVATAVLAAAMWRQIDVQPRLPAVDDIGQHTVLLAVIGATIVAVGIALAYQAADDAITTPAQVAVDTVTARQVSIAITTARSGPVTVVERRGNREVPLWSSAYLSSGATAHVVVPFPKARTTIALEDSGPADHRPELILDPVVLHDMLGTDCGSSTPSAIPVARAAACSWSEAIHVAP